ncbi:dihydrodipicolinate reductase [Mycobacterium sp. GA-2829]|uniref:NAD(P)H-dependent amine dehydrogenase family protein n=1 Tax=Mycobacterium sp. GA-2829 TaxID=1772283 RepID=UPI00073FCCB7|nr:dihydrodipicolinate reductase [Mycobacterium sp. GA-2829]KUI26888.1 dihydrodipicolinate reductase [Mycobacterium sp. GA-2829]
MDEEARTLRTVVWSTGGVRSVAIDAVAGRPDLELVGVWVHSVDKVGRDAGELAGREPLGLAATADAEALIALRPDCVVYAASGPQRDAGAVPDYLRLLSAGINVVTTTSTGLVYPPAYHSAQWRDALHETAIAGGASFYAPGVFPGFGSDQLALVLATQSKRIDVLTVTEVSLNDHYPVADVMMDGMGFGRPLDFVPLLQTPGFIEMAWRAPLQLMADALGVRITEVTGTLDRQLTDRDIEVAFGTIPAGTCGAVRTRAAAVVHGREAIVVEHIIRMARDVAPDWWNSDCDATYRVDIDGDPDVHCEMTLGDAEGHGAGRAAMAATAMRVVNAIPYVVRAPAGLLSSLDLPNTLPRHALGQLPVGVNKH